MSSRVYWSANLGASGPQAGPAYRFATGYVLLQKYGQFYCAGGK